MTDNTDQIIATFRQARTINRGIGIVALLIVCLLIGFNLPSLMNQPAHGATRPVYKGTVTIVYGQGVNDTYSLGAKYTASRWDVVKAAKAAGIGSYRVVKINSQRECYEVSSNAQCVMLFTSPDAIYNGNYVKDKPYAVLVVKDGRTILESQVGMSDKMGSKATSAQRQAWLTAAIKASVPR